MQQVSGLPVELDQKSLMPLFRSRRELRQAFVIPVGKINGFFEGLAAGKVLATRCKKCKRMYFPPKADCDSCGSPSLGFVELSRAAELVAFTTISVKPSSFSTYSDYVVAIGRLREGVNVLTWLVGADPSKVKVGMAMALQVKSRKEDGALVYVFEPARSSR